MSKQATEATSVAAKGMKIITSHIFPPIPIRSMDWSATLDGYEPGHPLGQGATEQEAIEDLLEQCRDS